MSPVFVAQKGVPPGPKAPPPDTPEGRFAPGDWMWVGIAIFCTWLLLTGLHRLFSGAPELAASPPPSVIPPPELQTTTEPPKPVPTSTYMMRSEAVEATVKSLRQHAKECPDAPDVLTEEQIKVIEQTGALLL
ncbi:MAG: hypothetical protein WCG36_02240 [bacterium]